MHLQGVENVYDLEWGAGVRYGDVRLREEIEQSTYVFGQIDMPGTEFSSEHRALFDSYYGFAERLLASDLVLPALDYCLKCSHVFNILDASGSIGVTERAVYILRVRKLAVAIAHGYVGSEQAGGDESSKGEKVSK